MNSDELVELYEKSPLDESITPYNDGTGFTLIRRYEGKDSYYHMDDRRIFIRLYLMGNKVWGGAEMVDAKKDDQNRYRIILDDKYNKKVTNYRFSDEEMISYAFDKNKILIEEKGVYLSLREFIDVLVVNHLKDRLFWRRLADKVVERFLKFIFWLSGKSYNRIDVMLKIYDPSYEIEKREGNDKAIEPFFKYFFISKNILLSFLVIALAASFFLIYKGFLKELSLSNLTIVILSFLVLFILEKLSIAFDKKIKRFFNKEKNLITRLHNIQLSSSFKLKIKKTQDER